MLWGIEQWKIHFECIARIAITVSCIILWSRDEARHLVRHHAMLVPLLLQCCLVQWSSNGGPRRHCKGSVHTLAKLTPLFYLSWCESIKGPIEQKSWCPASVPAKRIQKLWRSISPTVRNWHFWHSAKHQLNTVIGWTQHWKQCKTYRTTIIYEKKCVRLI